MASFTISMETILSVCPGANTSSCSWLTLKSSPLMAKPLVTKYTTETDPRTPWTLRMGSWNLPVSSVISYLQKIHRYNLQLSLHVLEVNAWQYTLVSIVNQFAVQCKAGVHKHSHGLSKGHLSLRTVIGWYNHFTHILASNRGWESAASTAH